MGWSNALLKGALLRSGIALDSKSIDWANWGGIHNAHIGAIARHPFTSNARTMVVFRYAVFIDILYIRKRYRTRIPLAAFSMDFRHFGTADLRNADRCGLGGFFATPKLRLPMHIVSGLSVSTRHFRNGRKMRVSVTRRSPLSDFVGFCWKYTAIRTFRSVEISQREIYVAIKMISGPL